jgi:hypothetical protein
MSLPWELGQHFGLSEPVNYRKLTVFKGVRFGRQDRDWNEELLAAELLDLQKSDYDLSLTGFDARDLDDLLLHDPPDVDAAPPLPLVAVTRLGDLWLCGSHRVLCGDATDAGAVLRLLGERQPLLLVTEPPYGIGFCRK